MSILKQPTELLLYQICFLSETDINQLKLVNRYLYYIIKKNEEYIYLKRLKTDYGKWILNPKILSRCLKYNININELKRYDLYKNILKKLILNNFEIANFLLTYIYEDINLQDEYRNNMLMSLLSNIHIQDYNLTFIKNIKLFLSKKPNVSFENYLNQTAIIYACKFCPDIDIIKTIIELGGNVHKRDFYGWNAIMYAISYNTKEVINFLKSFGKNYITLSDIT